MKFATLRNQALRRPWKSFTIVLDNGERVPVRHAENIFFLKDDEIIVYDNGNRWLFESGAVSAVQRRRGR